jgi:PAS domain-containing protein
VRSATACSQRTRRTRAELEEAIRHLDDSGDHFVTCYRRKDGTIYDVEISTNATQWEDQKFVLCVCRDISERLKAEKTLRESEEKYRTRFETMDQGVFYQRADGVITDCNPAALRMLGLSKEKFLNRTSEDPSWDLIYEDGSPVGKRKTSWAGRSWKSCPASSGIGSRRMGEWR